MLHTHDALLDAANYMRVIEQRHVLKLGCPEEIAHRRGYISAVELEETAAKLTKSEYGQYLLQIARET